MNFFRKHAASGASPKTEQTVRDYIANGSPNAQPLDDMRNILRLWMAAAPPAPDYKRLGELMDSFADDWQVSWKKGTSAKALDWFSRCGADDIITHKWGSHIIYGLALPHSKFGGIVLESTPIFWQNYKAVGSVIEIGVGGAYHVIAKASDREYFYLGHS